MGKELSTVAVTADSVESSLGDVLIQADNLHKTVYACTYCSSSHSIFALHPPRVNYGKKTVEYDCAARHHADVDNLEHHGNVVRPSGKKRPRTKRVDDEDGDDEGAD